MNGTGAAGDGGRSDGMDVDVKPSAPMAVAPVGRVVLMWGYLPGASPQKAPLLGPVVVPLPAAAAASPDAWKEVCGGGCGFAMALSENGKIFTWGSMDDMGHSYLAAGKHEENPEAFPLPSDAVIVKADAAWAHCVAVTDNGLVYTWGWRECIPTGRIVSDTRSMETVEKEDRESAVGTDQVSPRLQASRTNTGASSSASESKGSEDGSKRRKLSSAKHIPESSTSSEESLSAPPCVVMFSTGVKIRAVAAGGRHTLALSDFGQVWGWGYGGEGQLGLGSRIRSVSAPHPIPCIESAFYSKDRSSVSKGNKTLDGHASKVSGTCVKAIACGGRHSAVVTDSGALVTFGWGLYGQCGQGNTEDVLSPTCVSSILGIKIRSIAAGLWHTVCTSADGGVYSFGGNQFGQLGTGSEQAETLPKLLETACLENKNAEAVSCGARHSVMITDDGEVFCWGWNKYGQLGLGDAVDRNVPAQVSVDTYKPRSISCGWWHTLALAEHPT